MYESFRRWYILVGDWINLGLSHHTKMNHKSDAGCKIQDTCCGRSIVVLSLKLVKGKTADEAAAA